MKINKLEYTKIMNVSCDGKIKRTKNGTRTISNKYTKRNLSIKY